MANAVSVDVASAVTAMLTAATFSQKSLTIERSYADWDLELKGDESQQTRIDVVANTTGQGIQLAARGGPSSAKLQYIIPVDIAVRRKFGSDKQNDDTGRVLTSEVDALVRLTQEIHELFTPQRLTEFKAASWQQTDLVVCPDKDQLRKLRQFLAIVSVNFRAERTT